MLEENHKPVFDERTLATLLEAAYVVQEHNRKLHAMDLRIKSHDLTKEALHKEDLPQGAPAETVPVPVQTRSAPAKTEESPTPAGEDYTLTLAHIVETQHQIQLHALDLDHAIAVIAQRVAAIARADGAAMGMLEAGTIRYKAVSGQLTPAAGEDAPAEKALCAACLHGQIIRCRDIDVEIAIDADQCRRRGIQAMIAVPIYQVGGIAGALELYYANKQAFTEQDVHTCQLMAGLVTEALARGDELTWKQSLANERSVMLEALEKLKPDLAALVSGSAPGDSGARAAARTTATATSLCRKCGHELVGEEQFCGNCGSPRSAEMDKFVIPKHGPFGEERPTPLRHILTAPANGSDIPAPHLRSDENLPEKTLAESFEQEMPELFAALGLQTEGTPLPVEAAKPALQVNEAGPAMSPAPQEPKAEAETEELPLDPAPATTKGTYAWTSAAAARAFLEQVAAAAKPSSAVVRFWNARRGDFYLAIAVILVACVVRWGIWSSRPVSATVKPAVPAAAQHKPAPDADLSLFERILVKLGLAIPPEAPEDKGNPNAQVWVDQHTALYYCPGADLYGKTPKGKYTTQKDAQLDQFEPAYGKACE